MLSISALGGAGSAVDYYEHLQGDSVTGREDYYAAGGSGTFVGRGAEALGLAGEQTTVESFRDMAEGFHPRTGEALVQRAGELHRAGWDLTFSAPKSVSAAWAVADPQTREAIEIAHQAAVTAALDCMERNHVFSRTGHGGGSLSTDANRREAAGMIAATYQHFTNRNQDPQLHTHAVLMNVGVRADGSTGAIDSKPLYQSKMAGGAAYQAELAAQLREQGFTIEPGSKFGVDIAGVPAELRDDWSSRRAEIEKALKTSGHSSAAAAERAALATRSAKEHVDPAELQERWEQEAAQIAPDFNPASLRAEKPTRADGVMPSYADALQSLTQNNSVFRQRDADRLAFEAAQASGLNIRQAEAWTTDLMREHGVVMLVNERTGEHAYTTREMLEIERGILERGERMASSTSHAVSASDLHTSIQARPTLSSEQRAMVEHVISPGSLKVVEGAAGTGKSFALGAAREAWEKAGYEVRGCAVAGKAAEGLQSGAGIASTTVARLLADSAPRTDRHGQEHAPQNPLTYKTVLVVDEAGMIGSRQLNELLQRADHAGAKVVLAGDSGQLQPIEAGAPFRDLSQSLGAARLTDIRRQQAEADRQAVRDLAAGRAAAALENLAERGRLHVADTAHQARQAAGQAVVADLAAGKNSIAIAATRADVRAINQAAREAAQERGMLGESLLQTTVGPREFAQGDRVVMLQNDLSLQVKNGDFGTVQQVRPLPDGGAHIVVELDRLTADKDSITVVLDTREYASVDHGYAVTAHKSQGATVDTAHVCTTGAGMESREWSYVATSRAREATHIHADKVTSEELAGKWSRERQAESTSSWQADQVNNEQDSRAASDDYAEATESTADRDSDQAQHDNAGRSAADHSEEMAQDEPAPSNDALSTEAESADVAPEFDKLQEPSQDNAADVGHEEAEPELPDHDESSASTEVRDSAEPFDAEASGDVEDGPQVQKAESVEAFSEAPESPEADDVPDAREQQQADATQELPADAGIEPGHLEESVSLDSGDSVDLAEPEDAAEPTDSLTQHDLHVEPALDLDLAEPQWAGQGSEWATEADPEPAVERDAQATHEQTEHDQPHHDKEMELER